MNNLRKSAIAEQLQNLVAAAYQFACSLELGDERIEAFEFCEVLRRLQRHGTASEMLAATNPFLCSLDDDGDEDDDDE